MSKQYDESMKISRPWGMVSTHPCAGGRGAYLRGLVVTPHGFVSVISEEFSASGWHTHMRFVWRGRLYMRTIGARYTARGLAKKAAEFAREIAR